MMEIKTENIDEQAVYMKLSGELPKTKMGSLLLISISMNQPYQTGKYFTAIVDRIINQPETAPIKKVIVLVTDTLNRFNFQMEGLDEEQALLAAKKLGDKWLEQNKDAINLLKEKIPSTEVKRWDDYRLRYAKKFNDYLQEIKNIYDDVKNNNYKKVVNERAEQIANKCLNSESEIINNSNEGQLNNTSFNLMQKKGKIITLSEEYIFEESAIRPTLAYIENATHELYKGKLSPAVKVAYAKLVKKHPELTGFLKEIEIQETTQEEYLKDISKLNPLQKSEIISHFSDNNNFSNSFKFFGQTVQKSELEKNQETNSSSYVTDLMVYGYINNITFILNKLDDEKKIQLLEKLSQCLLEFGKENQHNNKQDSLTNGSNTSLWKPK